MIGQSSVLYYVCLIIIIIIIAQMAVFNVAGYLIDIEERRRWPVITAECHDGIAPPRGSWLLNYTP